MFPTEVLAAYLAAVPRVIIAPGPDNILAVSRVLRPTLSFLLILLADAASGADNCDAIRAQIEARIKAGGVASFALTTVDTAASGAGKLVGTCALGSKKILYVPAAGAAVAITKPRKDGSEPMLTECKDGSMSVGGDCKP